MTPFHVTATGHSLNYLPEYVAVDQGFFADEDLTVTASVPRPWDRVLDDLRDGTASAALGGIWVPSMYRDRADHLVPFAQIAARAPLALLGREAAADFSWQALPGKTVLMKGSNGASVGLYFKMRLREEGIDPGRIGFIQDLDGAMLSKLFLGGLGDYLVIDYPGALRLAAAGGCHIVQAFPVQGGPIPWSVYYALGPADDGRVQQQAVFCRALQRGMDWIQAREPESYGDFLTRIFPALPVDILLRAARTYRENAMWTTPLIDPEGYERWQLGIADGHLISAPIPYETLNDPRPTAALRAAA
ncbi:ABC transporter substrate-binding protein [Defluviimonas sp. SAOS-178_SWC]|uniref:ABC transporter substrate-binding protein n=1 Tax=Defluviimonas sp. SAOS-178_SWC TaxID=3121287 RepID=UPI00322178C6